ncbi:MAG: hypothetical protein ACD_58C00321G0001 [uncultured bacterium]|nr:MAG: hypothetical protein ACD_58C00321G0001 [uncultured bacterium]
MINLFNYPPTEEQVWTLMKVGIGGNTGLFGLRILTILIALVVFWFWFKKLKGGLSFNSSVTSIVLLTMSPAIWVLCWSYPLMVVKLVVVLCFVTFLKTKWWIVLLVLPGLGFYNVCFLKQNPAILSKITMSDARNEVNNRFMSEDTLRIKMELPLVWRRVGYNKLFITYRQVLAEVLPFFDLETLYFQEVHPMEQKSVVLFYWPEIFILIFGIYFWVTSKLKNEANNILLALLVISFTDFLFSNTVLYQRFMLMLIPLSLLMAYGLERILVVNRYVGAAVGVVLLYATYVNSYDISNRADFWLDNRPLVYQYWYEGIKPLGVENFEKINVSTLIGSSQNYCWFYLGDICKTDKFVFNSFNLSTGNIDSGLYAGFTGEFVGPKFKNDFSSDWETQLPARELTLISKENIRDTVAYKYGNDIGLVVKK